MGLCVPFPVAGHGPTLDPGSVALERGDTVAFVHYVAAVEARDIHVQGAVVRYRDADGRTTEQRSSAIRIDIAARATAEALPADMAECPRRHSEFASA